MTIKPYPLPTAAELEPYLRRYRNLGYKYERISEEYLKETGFDIT